MNGKLSSILKVTAGVLPLLLLGTAAVAEKSHGIAMYGEPALPADFDHLPYANPDAPHGGTFVMGETGGFDSLNPYILKGRAPFYLGAWTVETLMTRSIDEPFTLYGLLAESINTDPERSYVEFTLRPEARFSDGSPVTVDDVLWSFETLGTKGQPRYAGAWSKIKDAEQTGPHSVRFTFTEPDREMPLILGMRPILKKAQWDTQDFTQSSLVPPIGSGPYVVESITPDRSITYAKNPDWWGKDLPVNQGFYNFDTLRTEFYGDSGVMFEAFKAGSLSTWRETNPARWLTNFSFPAVQDGRVTLEEIEHKRPSGMQGFVFNTRKPIFDNARVREALIRAFDFDVINRTMTNGTEPRINSYFSNSELGMKVGEPAGEGEARLLAPYHDTLMSDVLEGYSLPDGPRRADLHVAMDLLADAGWTVENGVLTQHGKPFEFEILLSQGTDPGGTLSADQVSSVAAIYVQQLQRLGIKAHVTSVDSAQYKQRVNEFDFDMTVLTRSFSLSPGNEQTLYWGSIGANQPGSRNLMGMTSPAADAMITAMVRSETPEEFRDATRALDRVLMSGRFVIPFWYANVSRIAYSSAFAHPDHIPLYGDWPGFQPDVWWQKP
ncbi:extracellular solute-binding protein [Falsirhodobacter sp. alg1]|uniref:extracellular solute-binding protein n=1 Tax=Falsirhodobacter sp. alg1 TaxID=1472418 RepID=UPI0005EFE53A|nr:extracellular solute-binding protein [Falsirhodobacter sp. alg1]